MAEINPIKIKVPSQSFVKLGLKLSEKEYNDLLKEVIIRFNTEPRRYEKSDFGKLILAIIGARNIELSDLDNLSIDFQKELDKLKSDFLIEIDSVKLDITNLEVGEDNLINGIRINGTDIPVDDDKIADLTTYLPKESDHSITQSFTVNNPIGSIENGVTFNEGDKIEDILRQMLQKYIAPSAYISLDRNIAEIGEIVDEVIITYRLNTGSKPLISASITKNGEWFGNPGLEDYTTKYHDYNVSSKTVYILQVSDGYSTSSNSATINFYYPIYTGTTLQSIDDLVEDFKSTEIGLKKVMAPSSIEIRANGDPDSRLFAALPSGWNVAAMTDPNGFSVINNFEKRSILVKTGFCLDVPYTLYISANPQSNNSDYRIKLTLK